MAQIPIDVVCQRIDRKVPIVRPLLQRLEDNRVEIATQCASRRRVARPRRWATDGGFAIAPPVCAPSDARERTAGRTPTSSSYKTTPIEYTSVAMPSASPAICSGDA